MALDIALTVLEMDPLEQDLDGALLHILSHFSSLINLLWSLSSTRFSSFIAASLPFIISSPSDFSFPNFSPRVCHRPFPFMHAVQCLFSNLRTLSPLHGNCPRMTMSAI